MRCPETGHNPIVITGGLKDEILVIGWIREFTQSAENQDPGILPSDLIQLILRWHSQEEIHWIEYGNDLIEREHHVISTQDIFHLYCYEYKFYFVFVFVFASLISRLNQQYLHWMRYYHPNH